MAEKTILEFQTYKWLMNKSKRIPRTYYELTNERLKITKQGLITKDIKDIELFRVKDINVQQTFMGKVLDIGDIEVISSDISDPVIMLEKIKNPHGVKEEIRSAARDARRAEGILYKHNI